MLARAGNRMARSVRRQAARVDIVLPMTPVKNDIRLSVTARDRVTQELRNSPCLRRHLDDPAGIARMTRDELLSLAEKCEIDVEKIVEDVHKHGEGMESVLTPEEMERFNHSQRYPAFKGAIRVPITFGLGGKKSERLFRVKYSYTPEWDYYDVEKQQPMRGWEGGSRQHEIWAVPGENGLDQKPKWISADILTEIGVLSEAQELLIDDLIDEQCRAEDRRRRKAAGLDARKKQS